MRALTVSILGLLIACVALNVNGSVIPDEALTANLQDVWYEDEFIIALSNVKTKKKNVGGSSIETLLAVKYKQTKTKMVLILDRRTKRVVLESLDESGRRNAGHINVDSLAVNTPLKSLIILVHQTPINSRVDVYVDCIYEGSIPLKKTFRDIAETEDSPFIEVFRERRCRGKVYQSSITEALKKEQCPNNLIDMKQPSIFEKTPQPDSAKTHSNDPNKHKPKKRPTDRPDKIDGSDKSDTTNQNNHSTPSTDQTDTKRPNHRPDDKKTSSTKKPGDRDRPKKKEHPRRPGSNNKDDKYDSNGSSDPFSQPDQSNEKDNLNYAESSSLSSSFPLQSLHSTAQRPTKHQKKPHQSGTGSNESDQYDLDKSGQSDEIDDLDYPDGSHFSPLTSLSPYANKGHHPTKRPDKSHETSSRPDGSDGSDGLNPYDSNKKPFPTSESEEFESPDKLNRPGRSPGEGPEDSDGYPDDTNVSSPGKRKPRRGDIGIQSLDENVCQTGDQIVKTLNALINATRKLGRELELNRQETQHLRQLIENCSACRTPIGE